MKKARLVIKKNTLEWRKGFSAIEVLLAAAVFVIIVSAFVGAIIYGTQSQKTAGQYNQATLLADEAFEAVRNIRDSGYANLPVTDGTYYLSSAGNQWTLTSSPEPAINGFTRSITVTTIDVNTKQLVVNINFAPSAHRNKILSFTNRLTNWTAVAVLPKWVSPTNPGSLDLTGVMLGKKVHTVGNYAYLIRNDGTPDFQIINITNPAAPVAQGSLAIAGTNNMVYASGNYVYIASSNTSGELTIVNVTNPASPSLASTVNVANNLAGNTVYSSGNFAYLGRAGGTGNEFFIYNVTNPASPIVSGSLNLTGNPSINDIKVSGNYAYIATSNAAGEMLVINIINPAAPTVAGTYNPSGVVAASQITILGNYAYLSIDSIIHVINISNPLSPTAVTTYAAAGTVTDMDIDPVGNYLFISTNNATAEFQTLNILNPLAPTLMGNYDNPGGTFTINGISYNSSLDRVCAITINTAQEFKILAPN